MIRISKKKFIELLERELKMLEDGMTHFEKGKYLGSRLVEGGSKVYVENVFEKATEIYYSFFDFKSLVSFWWDDMTDEYGVQSVEELELLLESRGY